jgi:hypothetical protein
VPVQRALGRDFPNRKEKQLKSVKYFQDEIKREREGYGFGIYPGTLNYQL